MREIFFLIVGAALMAKVAHSSEQDGRLWGLVALALSLASLFIPLPFLRVGIALVVTGIAMLLFSMFSKPKGATIVRTVEKPPNPPA